jgi:ferrous iron transport protein B
LATILVAPLMSCSARLPVYTLLAGAFVPKTRYLGGLLGLQGLTIFAMYVLGIVTAVVVTLVLKRTLLKGGAPPFVMELPSYQRPSARVVLHRVLDRGWAFIRQAGTLIFAVAIVVWAAAYYPRSPQNLPPGVLEQREALEMRIARLESRSAAEGPAEDASRTQLEQLRAELGRVDDEIAGAHLRESFLGRAGRLVEPFVKPLGWDWRIGCAVVASFPAREVVIATLGVIYNLGERGDEGSPTLRATLRNATWEGTDRPVFNTPVALSLMVFYALCAQCASTLAVMKRETNSWGWPMFTFGYMTVLAYLGAMIAYQTGMLVLEAAAR